jgi:hypothetical protein
VVAGIRLIPKRIFQHDQLASAIAEIMTAAKKTAFTSSASMAARASPAYGEDRRRMERIEESGMDRFGTPRGARILWILLTNPGNRRSASAFDVDFCMATCDNSRQTFRAPFC